MYVLDVNLLMQLLEERIFSAIDFHLADICHHFTVQQHLRHLCDAPTSSDIRYAQ